MGEKFSRKFQSCTCSTSKIGFWNSFTFQEDTISKNTHEFQSIHIRTQARIFKIDSFVKNIEKSFFLEKFNFLILDLIEAVKCYVETMQLQQEQQQLEGACIFMLMHVWWIMQMRCTWRLKNNRRMWVSRLSSLKEKTIRWCRRRAKPKFPRVKIIIFYFRAINLLRSNNR